MLLPAPTTGPQSCSSQHCQVSNSVYNCISQVLEGGMYFSSLLSHPPDSCVLFLVVRFWPSPLVLSCCHNEIVHSKYTLPVNTDGTNCELKGWLPLKFFITAQTSWEQPITTIANYFKHPPELAGGGLGRA